MIAFSILECVEHFVKRHIRICFIALSLSLASWPAKTQDINPEATSREAKAVADDAGKTIADIKATFASRTLTDDQMTDSLREQRSSASRLLARIRAAISKSEIALQLVKLGVEKRIQQLSDREDLSEEEKSQTNNSEAQQYFTQSSATATAAQNEEIARQKDVAEKIDELKKNGVDVDGEKEKWSQAVSAMRRPITSSREAASKTLSEMSPNLRSLFERETSIDVSGKREIVAKYERILNVYKNIGAERLLNTSLLESVSRLREGESDLDSLVNKIDERFLAKINDNSRKDLFTSFTTGIFGIAVIVVIVYFFRLANNDNVRVALFQNDSGLQFVTLFSIVIAIILFGVLKILEAKELSALLGGLSGYILGRGSIAGRPAGSPNPSPAPPPAPVGDNA